MKNEEEIDLKVSIQDFYKLVIRNIDELDGLKFWCATEWSLFTQTGNSKSGLMMRYKYYFFHHPNHGQLKVMQWHKIDFNVDLHDTIEAIHFCHECGEPSEIGPRFLRYPGINEITK